MMERKLNRAEEDGGLVHEMVETLAVLGPDEGEKFFRWYEEAMPRTISKARKDVGILHRLRRIKEGMKEEVMRDGIKEGVNREGNSPNERMDFGKHAGRFDEEESGNSWEGR